MIYLVRVEILGEHQIDVQLYEQSVFEGHCSVGDAKLVRVNNIPRYIDPNELNQDLSFESKCY